jgi:hypothetical protein
VSGMSSSGVVVASVVAGAATDAAGNASLASTSTDNSVTFLINQAPVLSSIADVITLAQPYSFQAVASDPDLPDDTLTFSLTGPAWASVSTSGLVTLSPSAPADYGAHSVTVRVTDAGELFDEQTFDVTVVAPPRIALDDVMVVEGDSGTSNAVFRVLLSGPAPEQGVSVDYANFGTFSATPGDPTTPGADFVPESGTVTFAPGETVKTFTVPIVGNTTIENDEIFQYVLSAPVNGVLSGKSSAIGTILDNDDGLVRIGIDRKTVFEGDSAVPAADTPMVFTVLLSNSASDDVTVSYATQNGTAGSLDFDAKAGSLTFAPGETSKTITVQVIADTVAEGDEVFTLGLSGPSSNATISTQATVSNGWIVDDDGAGLLNAASLGTNPDSAAPTTAELNATLDAAISLWTEALGPGDPRLAQLDGLSIALTDFSGTTLGTTSGSTILIDSDAAGYGWFVDLTPAQNDEYRLRANGGILTATPRSEAFGRMDLLTAVMHEIGHALGFAHEDAAQYTVMRDALEAGTRYTLEAPRFESGTPRADALSGAIEWDAWGSDWTPSHKPRGGHAERHLPGFLFRF